MYANGFFEEKRRSPVSLAAVIGLHAAAFGAVVAFGTTTFIAEKAPIMKVITIPDEVPPPPVPPPPPRPPEQAQQLDRVTTTPQPVTPVNPTIAAPPTPPTIYQPPIAQPGQRTVIAAATIPAIPAPVRRDAEVDPRYRDALQPPYPRDEETAQRTGQVRVRVTVGTDGRVAAIERLASTSDSFWRATERQARARWRFRPATVDGRAVVATMIFTVTFRLRDA